MIIDTTDRKLKPPVLDKSKSSKTDIPRGEKIDDFKPVYIRKRDDDDGNHSDNEGGVK